MKKRFTSLLAICLIIICCLTGCGRYAGDDGKINIVTTIFPCYDFVRAVAGDNVNLKMLIKPGTECHTYDPTPSDILSVQNSDIFIMIGGESEEWTESILESVGGDGPEVIRLIECVDAIAEEETDGTDLSGHEHEHEHEEHDHEDEYDEHIWTSPSNAVKMVDTIASAVISADEENAEFYRGNADLYIRNIAEIRDKIGNVVDKSLSKTLIFGDRFPFLYFSKEFGLNCSAAFPGCSDQSEPGVATMKYLTDKVKNEKIPVVFYIELSNRRIADAICENTSAKALMLHSCHNVTKDEFERGETYVSLMNKNIKNLTEALK